MFQKSLLSSRRALLALGAPSTLVFSSLLRVYSCGNLEGTCFGPPR